MNNLKQIKTIVENLEVIKNKHEFKYFTVRNGKAKYHYIILSGNSVGLYCAYIQAHNGLCCRRALKPGTNINCFVKEK